MTRIMIPAHALSSSALSRRPIYFRDHSLRPEESAIHALSDFDRESPIFTTSDRTVREALADMDRLRIHALLVVDPAPGWRREVLGLLTHQAIVRHLGAGRRWQSGAEERVDRFMTSWDDLALVRFDSLLRLKISDLHGMFQGTGLTHVLVIEPGADGAPVARGLLSRAAVARRLSRDAGRGHPDAHPFTQTHPDEDPEAQALA